MYRRQQDEWDVHNLLHGALGRSVGAHVCRSLALPA